MTQEGNLTRPHRGKTPITELAGTFVHLSDRDLACRVLELTLEDQMKFLDNLDQTYRTLDPQTVKYLAAIGTVCSAIGRFPTSAVLSSGLQRFGTIAVASGGVSDIWRGGLDDTQVAMKAFRLHAQGLEEAKKILLKRMPIWRRLHHPNVLPLRGVNTTHFQLALIYDWGEYGNVTQYLSSHPRASHPSLLFDVAKGLEYLHSLDIPHGNLKGANVVVDGSGCARLTEYGLAPINTNPGFAIAATPGSAGTSRWLAPELITSPPNGNSMLVVETRAADVFAFGMLSVEVFTGEVPFRDLKWNEVVALHISQGDRPKMPRNAHEVGLTVEMWELLESCWQQDPGKRPTMREVVSIWQEFVKKDDELTALSEESQHMAGFGVCNTNSRRRTTAGSPQPQTEVEAIQPGTVPEIVQRGSNSEAIQLRPVRGAPEPGTEHNTQIPKQVPRSGVALQRPKPGVAQPVTNVRDPPPVRTRRRWICGLF